MSAETPSSPPSTPRKPRSAVERSIVWGGILILLAIVWLEYTAKNAQSAAVARLLEMIREVELTPPELKVDEIKAAHVKAVVGNKIPRVEDVGAKLLAIGGKRLEVYRWFSINPLKPREMYVYYTGGEDSDVLTVTTEEQTETILMQYPELSAIQKESMLRNATAGARPMTPNANPAEDISKGDSSPAVRTRTALEAARPSQ